jgi:ABC-type glutathione transport system ATPase component
VIAIDDVLRSPASARTALSGLDAVRRRLERDRAGKKERLGELTAKIDLAPRVETALRALSESLFAQLVGVIEEKLTIALQEVLGQPIELKAEVSYKRSAASVEFYVERAGKKEDIMKGQGGSVANVLSVGLRMFALATLEPNEHRGFLVLDEQDCWLRPELVPALVKIVREACDALGFQVLMISHHDPRLFEAYADRVYRLAPQPDGSVKVDLVADRLASLAG